MTIEVILLLFVAGAALAFLVAVLVVAAWFGRNSNEREICPSCGARALKFVVWILPEFTGHGRKAPDSWTYFVCESCGAHYKQDDGVFAVPSDQEWADYCSKVIEAGRRQ